MYLALDPHLAFARMAGAIPLDATEKQLKAIRDAYKTVNLGVLYGQSEFGIAERLGIELVDAAALLQRHRELFSTYWNWSERITQAAYDRGYATTRCGWRAWVRPGSKLRTWQNFPIQSTGADIMRAMTIALDRQNSQTLAIVHDGWLLCCLR